MSFIPSPDVLREMGGSAKSRLLSSCVDPAGWLYAASEGYNNLFGRDSCITALLLLESFLVTKDRSILPPIRATLLELAYYQGREFNIESGEEPGKIIHELKKKPDHKHNPPDYVYPDGTVRLYDSVDSTVLFPLAVYRYLEVAEATDPSFWRDIQPAVNAALAWIASNVSKSPYGFICYWDPSKRRYFFLSIQSWMDYSGNAKERGIIYPVAPVEVQAYLYAVYHLWGRRLNRPDLIQAGERLYIEFNRHFWVMKGRRHFLAANLFGDGSLDIEVRSSMGHCLWAALRTDDVPDGFHRCIASDPRAIVRRLMAVDMFSPIAGIRTLSNKSPAYGTQAHLGPEWPHDIAMAWWGMIQLGFYSEARSVAKAILNIAQVHGTPGMELVFARDGVFLNLKEQLGGDAKREQAWSLAGTILICAYYISISARARH